MESEMRTIIFDTETTGLIKNSVAALNLQPHIIEFYGCVLGDDMEIVDELEFICDPGIKIEKIITKITGFKQSDLDGQIKFKEKAEEVVELIESCDRVVAHNLSYDMSLVDLEMKRLKRAIAWPESRICTVEATEWYKGHRLNLASLYELLFEETFPGAHRAKNDVMALKRCYEELVKRGDV
jgi:DNA polymerase III epsilon subunit-like protein